MTSSAEAVTSYFRTQNTAVYVWSLQNFFLLILVIAYIIQGPRRNKTLIWSVHDGLLKYGGFAKYIEGSAPPRLS